MPPRDVFSNVPSQRVPRDGDHARARRRLLAASGVLGLAAVLVWISQTPPDRSLEIRAAQAVRQGAPGPEGATAATRERPASPVPEPAREAAPDREAMLASGRFELLRDSLARLEDDATRDRWTETFARLAPPEMVVPHLLALGEGKARDEWLRAGMARWAVNSPAEFARWMHAAPLADADLEQAAAALFEADDELRREPRIAIACALDMASPALRLRVLRRALADWAGRDRPGALRFVESTDAIDAATRDDLRALLRPPVPET